MNHMKFESPDLTSGNIEKIAALFPNCITEMLDEERSTPEKKVYKRAVNFELLKQMLSPDVVDGDEAYEFTWVGKKAAIVEANKPIRKTLRPCVAESKDWDTTENLYIEGDNLEVLKLLQESYLGKVKMIYIDPPYNTGNDFIYADDFKMESEEWKVESGEWSEEGDRLFKNTDTNGRFHSDWCSMIYSRLLLARNLLTDDGVILISIDENEVKCLGMICDEVFGKRNFIECFVYDKKAAAKGVPPVNMVCGVHEYIFAYAKNFSRFSFIGAPRSVDGFANPDNDPRGIWRNTNIKSTTSENRFEIIDPETGNKFIDTWAFSPMELGRMIRENRLLFPKTPNGQVRAKEFYSEFKNANTPIKSSLGLYDAQWNTEMLVDLMGGKYFQNPKHLKLMHNLISFTISGDDIILDFFSGSATTAHAVMQLNAEDGGHRKFIMVQLPEKCDEKSEAYKAGYKNICEIGKERIRRAGEKILKEQLANNNSTLNSPNSKLDIGFRVLKLDSTNMKDVYYAPCDYDQDFLHQLESNIKDDRTDLDLLFGCLIDWGLPLSLPYKSEQIDGCTVHTYNDGDLIACFDANVPESVVKEIAQRKPLRAVFRDSGFESSPEKINMFEIFKLYMPEDAGDITKRVRVI